MQSSTDEDDERDDSSVFVKGAKAIDSDLPEVLDSDEDAEGGDFDISVVEGDFFIGEPDAQDSPGEEEYLPKQQQRRVDNTLNISPSNRRLDALAKIIEVYSGSTCIAVCVIGAQVFISSNDLKDGARGRTIDSESVQERNL